MKDHILKNKAIKLRRQGMSFKEIASVLSVSPSTGYAWLKNVSLTKQARQALIRSQTLGRRKGLLAIQSNRDIIYREIQLQAGKYLSSLPCAPVYYKLLCAFLYWGEGEKSSKSIVFTNSDPVMVKTFLTLFRKGFVTAEDKFSAYLHLHAYHNIPRQIKFWSGITGIHKNKIHVYNKASSSIYKKEYYQGCISVRYHDASIAKEIAFIYNGFAQLI